jgi:tetratricopeptide (TPR) repeat protein
MFPQGDQTDPKETSNGKCPFQRFWSKISDSVKTRKSSIIIIFICLIVVIGYPLWILFTNDKNVVEPFDTIGMGDKNLSGAAISALFLFDLSQIYEVYDSFNLDLTSSQNGQASNQDGLASFQMEAHKTQTHDHFDLSNDKSMPIVAGLGTVGVGGSSLSIGNIILLYETFLRSILKNDMSISGSLQRYGSMISIEAIMRGKVKKIRGNDYFVAQEVNLPLNNDSQLVAENNIHSLVNELALKIAYGNLIHDSDWKKELPQTFPAFKNLTEGLIAINNYTLTDDPRALYESKNKLLSIRYNEPSYHTQYYLKLLNNLGDLYSTSSDEENNNSSEVFRNIADFVSNNAINSGIDYATKPDADDSDYSKALIKFYEATQLNQNSSEAWDDMGWALSNLGEYSEAIKAFNESIRLNLDSGMEPNAIVWLDRGYAFEQLNNDNSSLADYENATKRSPSDFYSWIYEGDLLSKLGRYSEAKEAYDKAILIDPQDPYVWRKESLALSLNNSTAFIKSGDYSDSRLAEEIAKELETDPL